MLVVEDETQILELCKRILERLGYTVLSARTPEAALKINADHPGEIQMLVTDVVMPAMNGKDLSSLVKQNQPGIKTLFVPGYPSEVIANKGVIANGFHFIQKPFTGGELSKKLRSVLSS